MDGGNPPRYFNGRPPFLLTAPIGLRVPPCQRLVLMPPRVSV